LLTVGFGNCLKDNKNDWGWSPWSSGLYRPICYYFCFYVILRFFQNPKTSHFTFFLRFLKQCFTDSL